MTLTLTLTLAAVLTLASGEYELVVLGVEGPICAKSRAGCEAARAAIAADPQRWPLVPRATPTYCIPHTGCFSPESNCIANFNCGGGR